MVSTLPSGSIDGQRLEDAVGAGLVIVSGHHRLETVRPHRFATASLIRRDDDPPEPGLGAAAGDLHDHRRAGNVGQRLARQAGRGHAGRDEDKRGHRGCGAFEKRMGKVAKGLTGSALICVATPEQKT